MTDMFFNNSFNPGRITQEEAKTVSVVPVGVGLESDRIQDSLVVDHLVPFVLWVRVDGIVLGFPDDVMSFGDLGLTWLEEGLLKLIDDIGFHDVVVELGFAFAVKAESPHLAFHETKFGLVPIVLGTRRHEFTNVILLMQFTGKVPEVIPQVWVGLAFVCNEDDRVGVVVQHTFLQLLQGGIEFEPGPTGSETGYKNVKVG